MMFEDSSLSCYNIQFDIRSQCLTGDDKDFGVDVEVAVDKSTHLKIDNWFYKNLLDVIYSFLCVTPVRDGRASERRNFTSVEKSKELKKGKNKKTNLT